MIENTKNFASLLFALIVTLIVSCNKTYEEFNSEESSVRVTRSTTNAAEANYHHYALVWKNSATVDDAGAFGFSEATSVGELAPFSLKNGTYLFRVIATSSPTLLQFNSVLGINSNANTQISIAKGVLVPDLLIGSVTADITGNNSVVVDVARPIAKCRLLLTGIPSLPAVRSVVIRIGGLTDRIDLTGSCFVSNGDDSGVEYSLNTTVANGEIDASFYIFPSVKRGDSTPIYLDFDYLNGTNATFKTLASTVFESGDSKTVTGTMTSVANSVSTTINYSPWNVTEAPFEVVFDPEEGDNGTSGDVLVGDYKEGGIVFTKGKVIGKMEKVESEWSTIALILRGLNSADGLTNFNTLNTTMSGNFSGFPAFKYANDQRSSGEWYIPSKEEWTQIYANIGKLNSSMQLNGGTKISIGSVSEYWTSTEASASDAYTIKTSSGISGASNKGIKKSVRLVKKMVYP